MPTELTQIETLRADPAKTRVVTRAMPALEPGEVLARIDTFALTANNVSYAVSGEQLGYWGFFPTEAPWGIVPVWGFATIIESRSDGIAVGERVWGFLPMASHLVMQPGKVTRGGFVDMAPHRQALPGLYNRYDRTLDDKPELAALDVERCALTPLFTTAFVIDDFLADNGFFGARQVLVLSASSKTGFGLADLLHRREGRPVQVVGVTSIGNRDFVSALGVCDHVIAYGEIEDLDASIPTVVVDMAGSGEVLARVHRHFADRLAYSCIVGATHWTERGRRPDLPGAPPTFFFAPSQIAKREADWGPGEILRRARNEGLRIARDTAHLRTVETVAGPEACQAAFTEMVAGRVAPDRILMLGLNPVTVDS